MSCLVPGGHESLDKEQLTSTELWLRGSGLGGLSVLGLCHFGARWGCTAPDRPGVQSGGPPGLMLYTQRVNGSCD